MKPGSEKNLGWVFERKWWHNVSKWTQKKLRGSTPTRWVYLVPFHLLPELGATYIQIPEALHVTPLQMCSYSKREAKKRTQTFPKAPRRHVWMSVSGTWEFIWLSNPEETQGIWLRLKDLHVVATNENSSAKLPGYKELPGLFPGPGKSSWASLSLDTSTHPPQEAMLVWGAGVLHII